MTDADVLIVGFRCAGAPLALALHRAGVRVIVIDKDPFFSDQPMSTHAIQPYGMKMFDRLGLGDLVRSLAPPNRAFRFQVGEHFMQVDLDGTDLDSVSPRRSKLDPALQRAALEAGVEARDRTRLVSLLRDGDRVTGARVRNGDGEHEIRARLVVGADGRHSTVARLVGSPAYLEARSPNGIYWSYFEKTRVFDEDPRYAWGACIHVNGDRARAVFQTDSGLLLMAGGGRRSVVEAWKRNPAQSLEADLREAPLTAPLLEGSRMVAEPVGLLALDMFMKKAVGPGWALVGDAGLHLDPTPGLGIADAARDAVLLSEAILEGSERALHLYWRRRDVDSIGLFHFAADMGSEGYDNPFTRMAFRHVERSARVRRRLRESMARKLDPFEVMPPGTLVGWLLAESLRANFAPWTGLGRAFRLGRRVEGQRAVLSRALAKVERGDLDETAPLLPG